MMKILFLIIIFHGIGYSQTAPAEGYIVKEVFFSEVIYSVVDSLSSEFKEELEIYPRFVLDKTDKQCLSESLDIVKMLVTYRPTFVSDDYKIMENSGCSINKDISKGVVFSLPIINSYTNLLVLNVKYNKSRFCFEYQIPPEMIIKSVLHINKRFTPDTNIVFKNDLLDTLILPQKKLRHQKKNELQH